MKNLRNKIVNPSFPVIFYELLPPSHTIGEESLDAYIDCAIDLLMSSPIAIDAVNIPEIREENHKEIKRTESYMPKMNPALFAQMLEKASYEHLDVVLNHCTVYEPWEEQLKWLETITYQHNIRTCILVGGTTSKISYPGPDLIEMSDYIQVHHQQDLFCGGITIQTRRYNDQNKDEPYRLLRKSKHGLAFFTSQIIYEPLSIKLLLKDYANICRQQEISPSRIFLSFAPISTHKDLDFLRWLGVIVPKSIERELFKADIGIGWRSAKVAVNIFQEILNYMHDEEIYIPLGINVEHITLHNFELSLEFIERLGKLYHDYMRSVIPNNM
ncbi:MAG: hypothetical protein KIT56_08560 [Gammaproteobacteria bacterium]|nr:hypothetical protein [Gammaproteobacteria bacterium]MCW5583909.1 hypothetical protein [Gammaproteobacteria bacterium]